MEDVFTFTPNDPRSAMKLKVDFRNIKGKVAFLIFSPSRFACPIIFMKQSCFGSFQASLIVNPFHVISRSQIQ